MRFFARDKMAMVEPDTALPGRSEELRVPERHEVLGTPLMWNDESQRAAAEASREAYQQMLTAAGHGTITTELLEHDAAHPFYYAEDYHQQYLVKNPGGYCGLGGTGVACPVGIGAAPSRE